MNILILGSGGREHALAWATLQNPKCDKLIVAPGNAGIAQIAECAALNITDGPALAEFCSENTIDLVIVGPEALCDESSRIDRFHIVLAKTLGPICSHGHESSHQNTRDKTERHHRFSMVVNEQPQSKEGPVFEEFRVCSTLHKAADWKGVFESASARQTPGVVPNTSLVAEARS